MAGEDEVVTRAILDYELTALEDRPVEQMRGMGTSLLREFRKWAMPRNYRVTALETLHERLALIEERLTVIEKPKPWTEGDTRSTLLRHNRLF